MFYHSSLKGGFENELSKIQKPPNEKLESYENVRLVSPFHKRVFVYNLKLSIKHFHTTIIAQLFQDCKKSCGKPKRAFVEQVV